MYAILQDRHRQKMPYHIYGAIPRSMCAPLCIHNEYYTPLSTSDGRSCSRTKPFVSLHVRVRGSQLMYYRSEQDNSHCKRQYVAITTFYPLLKTEFINDIKNAEERVSKIVHSCIHLTPRYS